MRYVRRIIFKMNDRGDRLIIEFNPEDVEKLTKWKRLCWAVYGRGGMKKRINDVLDEDIKILEGMNK